MRSRHVVVAVGNALRGDDAVGIAVAARLRGRLPDGTELVECEQEPSRLLDAWEGAEVALVVDACCCGLAPGTVHRFDASGEPLPARVFRSSTHAFGVADAVEVARALARLPARLLVYGVEGTDFRTGAGLSPAVEAAVGHVADAIVRDLRSAGIHA
jgi:hydrogenase maturation protease